MAELPANNTLTVHPDGIVELIQTGHQTLASIGQFQSKIDQLTVDAHAKSRKSLILVDVSGVTGHDPAAREEGRKRLDGDYDAMAICGNSTTVRLIVNWLIHTVGRTDKVQFFSTREEALRWLHSHV